MITIEIKENRSCTWRTTQCLRHRLNGPAHVSLYKNGRKSSECYFVNGNRHRIDGPAYRSWHLNGKISCECYYVYDMRHRSTNFFFIPPSDERLF